MRRARQEEVGAVLGESFSQRDVEQLQKLSVEQLTFLRDLTVGGGPRNLNAREVWREGDLGDSNGHHWWGTEVRPVDQLSISGMALVCNPGAFWLRRAIWLVIIICLLVWLCFQLKLCVDRFSAGGTVRVRSQTRLANIPLPAITLCHGNKLKSSAVKAHQRAGAKWKQWLTDGFGSLNWTSFDDLNTFYTSATYSWRDMVFWCLISGRSCSKLGRVTTSATHLHGLCTTFTTNVTVPRRLLSGQVSLVIREKETFAEFEHGGWNVFIHPKYLKFDDFLFLSGNTLKLKVVSGRYHRVVLGHIITDVLSARSEAGACSVAPRAQKSHLSCLRRCMLSTLADNIDSNNGTLCRVPWMPAQLYSNDTPFCNSKQNFQRSWCDGPGIGGEMEFLKFTTACPCIPSCHTDTYHVRRQEKWHMEETSVYIRYPRAKGHMFGSLQLWLEDVEEHLVEQEAYSFTSFVADVGGNLGLMLGGSLLTLVEILDCAVSSVMFRSAKTSKVRG